LRFEISDSQIAREKCGDFSQRARRDKITEQFFHAKLIVVKKIFFWRTRYLTGLVSRKISGGDFLLR
jgi:hypothetical protein